MLSSSDKIREVNVMVTIYVNEFSKSQNVNSIIIAP